MTYTCPYKKIHKNEKLCFCFREIERDRIDREQQIKRETPLTVEEQAKINRIFTEAREYFKKKGTFTKKDNLFQDKNIINLENCVMCGNKLSKSVARTCGGECWTKERQKI